MVRTVIKVAVALLVVALVWKAFSGGEQMTLEEYQSDEQRVEA